jgi:hypothetical protein
MSTFTWRAGRLALSVLVAAIALTLTACSLSAAPQPQPFEEPAANGAPVAGEEPAVAENPPAQAPTAVWTCAYVPTINDDWHDDALCSNGTEIQRPYLREGDDFVTEDEIMASAAEFAAELNIAG